MRRQECPSFLCGEYSHCWDIHFLLVQSSDSGNICQEQTWLRGEGRQLFTVGSLCKQDYFSVRPEAVWRSLILPPAQPPFIGADYLVVFLLVTTCLRFARSHTNHHEQTSLRVVRYGNPFNLTEKVVGLCKALVKLAFWSPIVSAGDAPLVVWGRWTSASSVPYHCQER